MKNNNEIMMAGRPDSIVFFIFLFLLRSTLAMNLEGFPFSPHTFTTQPGFPSSSNSKVALFIFMFGKVVTKLKLHNCIGGCHIISYHQHHHHHHHIDKLSVVRSQHNVTLSISAFLWSTKMLGFVQTTTLSSEKHRLVLQREVIVEIEIIT